MLFKAPCAAPRCSVWQPLLIDQELINTKSSNYRKLTGDFSSMDQSTDGNIENKPNAAKPLYQRYLVSFPTAVCLVLSLGSIAACFLMTFKTHQMESRLRELEIKMTDSCQESPKDVSVSQELRRSIETLFQEASILILQKGKLQHHVSYTVSRVSVVCYPISH